MSAASRRLFALAFIGALWIGSARLHAVTVRDIIELTRAGLSDDILIALIETDKTVFTLSPEQIVELKKKGVSDRVVVAMLQQGRMRLEPQPVDPPPLPDYAPPPAYQPPPPPPPSTTVVVVQTPVYYPIPFFVPLRTRPVHCEPGRIIGRTEKLSHPVPGRWLANGRTGGLVFVSDPVCQ